MTGVALPPDALSALAERPAPAPPRPYDFPAFTRTRLSGGLTVIRAHLPARPLLSAQLLFPGGAGDEPAELAGVTSLMARALLEGTQERDAFAFLDATERLGAEFRADARWESVLTGFDVPRSDFAGALELLAEMVHRASFADAEIHRLRAERLNDLLQAKADPRRRADDAFQETIYASSTPFSRPIGGREETVSLIDREAIVARHQSVMRTDSATLIVAGDLEGVPLMELAAAHLDRPAGKADGVGFPTLGDAPHPDAPRLIIIDRPGSPQTEVRVGHVGLRRRIPDFHAVSVMNAVLGGLFNSRLQRVLRDEHGYTYGVSSSFDLRRSAGPFTVRTAVQTEVTAAAIRAIFRELHRIRVEPLTDGELHDGRDYLGGIFALRFRTPAQVASAIGDLVTFELPDDELDRYRAAIGAVTAADAALAARHVLPEQASVVMVADAGRVEGEVRSTDIGLPIVVERGGS